jgi:hypothetical protein
MPSNWNYVAAGYLITAGSIVLYAVSIRLRARRARRLIADETRD